jgi:hypothetical protein
MGNSIQVLAKNTTAGLFTNGSEFSVRTTNRSETQTLTIADKSFRHKVKIYILNEILGQKCLSIRLVMM